MEEAKVEGFLVISKESKWQSSHTKEQQIFKSQCRCTEVYYLAVNSFLWLRVVQLIEKILSCFKRPAKVE